MGNGGLKDEKGSTYNCHSCAGRGCDKIENPEKPD
jgi:hypothetical protein